MSKISSIFGGGGSSTSVQQTSQNRTEVTLTNQIANVIDVEPLAASFTAIGELFNETVKNGTAQTKSLLTALSAQIGVSQQAAILNAAVDAEAEQERNSLLARGLDMLKIAGLFVAGYFLWRSLK